MMTKTGTILVILGAALSVSAMRSTNTVSGTVDTRDYILTVSSAYGTISAPESGTSTNSWHSMVYSSVSGSPEYEPEGTTLHSLTGFAGEGTDPVSGTGTAWVKLTNVTSSISWQWNTLHWIAWSVLGQGEIRSSGSYTVNGAWCQEDESYEFQAVPEWGWLFTGWSGGASGGPSATNLNFTATEPASLLASFSDDPDGDGLKNTNEWASGANPWMTDTDGDNFDDNMEFINGGNPAVSDSWRISHIQDNPETFGLYNSNAVLDVAVGQVALGIEGTTARLRLQVEQSEDLVTWTNAGDVLEWTLPVGGEKQFLRVRSAPGE